MHPVLFNHQTPALLAELLIKVAGALPTPGSLTATRLVTTVLGAISWGQVQARRSLGLGGDSDELLEMYYEWTALAARGRSAPPNPLQCCLDERHDELYLRYFGSSPAAAKARPLPETTPARFVQARKQHQQVTDALSACDFVWELIAGAREGTGSTFQEYTQALVAQKKTCVFDMLRLSTLHPSPELQAVLTKEILVEHLAGARTTPPLLSDLRGSAARHAI